MRIQHALEAASAVVQRFAPGSFSVRDNGGRDVVTQVDRAVSDCAPHRIAEVG